jgi:hypothetical protein
MPEVIDKVLVEQPFTIRPEKAKGLGRSTSWVLSRSMSGSRLMGGTTWLS